MATDGGELSATQGTIGELAIKANLVVVGGFAATGRASGGFACSGR